MAKKVLVIVFLIVGLLGVAACSGSDDGDGKSSDEKSSQQGGMEPDLSGIPDVVAEVNGQEIKKDEFVNAYKGQFQQMTMQAQQTGQKPDQEKLKKQVAENLVGTELLVQEADKRGLKATQQRVDKTLNDLAKQNGIGSKDKLFATLKKQGMDKSDVINDVKTQVKVRQLISKEAGNTKPTEKELRKLYDQMVAQQKQSGQDGQKVPSFKEVKPQLEQQLTSQKESSVAQKLIDKLRKDATVKINL